MLSDNVAILLKVTRTREYSSGLCKAKEKEKANSIKAGLPLTFFKMVCKCFKYNVLHNISISSAVKLNKAFERDIETCLLN